MLVNQANTWQSINDAECIWRLMTSTVARMLARCTTHTQSNRLAHRDTPSTVSVFDMGDNSCNPGHPDIAASILKMGSTLHNELAHG